MAAALRIFVSAGEASGDLYGALLIRALGERLGEAEFFGCGGDRMREAGCRTLVDARRVAMVGLVEVLPGLPRAWSALGLLRRAIRRDPPSLAILIDFPEFNLRLAKQLKRAGTPVLYFVAPQVWAWRRGRLPALRQSVTRLLCIFSFEESFFRSAGVAAEFVGHPLLGRVAPAMSAPEFRARFRLPEKASLIALLPGSRRREILLNLPPLIESARRLAAGGEFCFVVPAASTAGGEWLRAAVANSDLSLHVIEGHTYDVVGHAAVAVVASGTATIEAALLGTPMVVVYRVSRLSWWLGRRLVHAPFLSMVNLVAGRKIVPELIQQEFEPETVAREVRRLLDDPLARGRMQQDLRELAEKLRPPTPRSVEARQSGPEEAAESADAIQRAAWIAESLLEGEHRGRETRGLPVASA